KKTNRCLVVHEAPRTGGIAGEIVARLNEYCFEWLDAPVRRVTAPDTPVPFSPPLEDHFIVQVDDVARAARWMLEY
ncbi:MAG TPA: transketolase C-terminal domain-containing protein, partial [Gemmatimonadota bacterium]|nr:transketolase C-terminal domain-containing protein [Gemmatimonadota bacterium]